MALTQREKNVRYYWRHKDERQASHAKRCLDYYHDNAERINAKRRVRRKLKSTPQELLAVKLQRILKIPIWEARGMVQRMPR